MTAARITKRRISTNTSGTESLCGNKYEEMSREFGPEHMAQSRVSKTLRSAGAEKKTHEEIKVMPKGDGSRLKLKACHSFMEYIV